MTAAPRYLRPKELHTVLLHPSPFNASLFTPSKEVLISLKSFLTTSSYPNPEDLFSLALDVWSKTISVNLSSSIRRIWLSHLNLSVTIALESRIELKFSYSPHFEMGSLSRVPKTMRRQFLLKRSSKIYSVFRSTYASKPCLVTVINVVFNVLILIWGLSSNSSKPFFNEKTL